MKYCASTDVVSKVHRLHIASIENMQDCVDSKYIHVVSNSEVAVTESKGVREINE